MPPLDSFEEFNRRAQQIASEANASLERALATIRTGAKTGATGPAGPVGGAVTLAEEQKVISGVVAELETSVQRVNRIVTELQAAATRGAPARGAAPPVVGGLTRTQGGLLVPADVYTGGGGGRGGGGRPPAPPTPPEPPPGSAGDPSSRARAIQAEAQATARVRAEMQRNIAVLGSYNQEYRKHGALTTEFISAAARGEASYREWGYQIGATAAKFAGWTAVSIPVFAALDGVRSIGRGAIQSASGVQVLGNYINGLDTSRAQAQMRALADQFNLPISDVSDAFQGMGRVFHDQASAAKATEAALYGVKVGELSAADSTKYLTSIVNGFHLPAQQLVGLFDQVNQAQNLYGVNIQDTIAGTAQAAGAWRAAGDTGLKGYSDLLALVITGQRATGRSGIQMATALQRSAEIIRRSPKNQAALRAFGIDPTQNINEVYQQAFQQVQSGAVKGPDVTKLATALSTPQLSSRITPLLQNFQLYQKVLNDTSPEAAKGSAQRELANRLQSVTERLHRFTTELEILGSNLVSAGFAAPLGGALTLVEKLLHGFNGLFGVLNNAPDPFRQMFVAGTSLLVLLRTLQRFQIAPGLTSKFGAIGGQRGLVQDTGELGQRRQVSRYLRDEQTFLRDSAQQAARTAALARQRAVVAQSEAEAEVNLAHNSAEAKAAQGRAFLARDAARNATIEEVAINRELAASEARNLAFRQEVVSLRSRELTASQFAQRENLAIVPTLERPTPVRPQYLSPAGEQRGNWLLSRPGLSAPEARATRAGEAAAASAGSQAEATVAYMAAAETEMVRQQSLMVRAQSRMREVGTGMGAMRSKIGAAALGFRQSLGGAAAAMGAMIGPFEIILAGALIIPAIYEHEKAAIEAHNKLLDELSRTPVTKSDFDNLQQQATKTATAKPGPIETLRRGVPAELSKIGLPVFAALMPHGTAQEQEQKAAEDAQNYAYTTLSNWNNQLAQGKPRTGAFRDLIQTTVTRNVKDIKDGTVGVAEARKLLATRLQEVMTEVGVTEQQRATDIYNVRSAFHLAGIKGGKGGETAFFNHLWNLNQTDMKTVTDSLGAIVQTGYGTLRQVHEYGEALLVSISQAEGTKDPTTRAALSGAAIGALESAMKDAGQREFDRATLFARTQAQRDKAWDAYVNAPNKLYVQPERQQLKGVQASESNVRSQIKGAEGDARSMRQAMSAAFGAGDYGTAAQIGVDLLQNAKHISDLRNRLKKLGDRDKAITKGLKVAEQEQKYLEAERKRQQFEDQQATFDATTQAESFTRAPGVPRALYVLGRVHQQMLAAIKEYGRDSKEAQAAISNYRQQEEQAAQEQENLAQAYENLKEAGIADPIAKARVHAQDLKDRLARWRRTGGHSQADIVNLMAEIKDADLAAQQQILQDQTARNDAYYQWLESQTTDPLKQADLEVKRTARDIRFARTPTERYQAMAAHNQAIQSRRETMVNQRASDIDFELEMGRITNQQAAAMYENLAKTAKLPKDLRRQFLLKAHQLIKDLQNQSDLELNVGNIRLPTAYEIRSAMGIDKSQGGNAAPQVNNNTINIAVHDKSAVDEVNRVVEHHTRSNLRAKARARGVRGRG